MRIKPNFLFLSLASFLTVGLSWAVPALADDPGYTYVDVQQLWLNEQTQTDRDFSVFDGDLHISADAGTLKPGGRIQVIELEPTADSPLNTPDGYKRISPIFQYDLKGTALAGTNYSLGLEVSFDSKLEFSKFAMRFDQAQKRWVSLASATNLENSSLKFNSGLNSLIFAVFDTDYMVHGHASWYKYKNCMCAASPDYPKGTKLLVTNDNQGKSILVTVNDWGPERDIFPERVIDLDLVAFEKFGSRRIGVLKNIKVVPFISEKYSAETVAALMVGEAVELEAASGAKTASADSKTEAVEKVVVDAPKPVVSIYKSPDEEAKAAYLAYMQSIK